MYCKTSDLKGDETKLKYAASITSQAPYAAFTEPTHPTPEEDSDCDYLEAKPIATTKTTTRSTSAPCHSLPTTTRPCEKTTVTCPYATPKTTGTSWMTSKIIQCITPRPTIWTTKPCPTVRITRKPSLSTTTTRTTMEKFTKCCNRPVTWLTTTEKIIPVSFLPFEPVENNVIIESEENVTPTKDHIVVVDVTVPDHIVIKDVTDPPTTDPSFEDTPAKNMTATKSQTTSLRTTNARATEPPTVTRDADIIVNTEQELSKPTQSKSSLRSTIKSTTITEIEKPITSSEKERETTSSGGAEILILKLDETEKSTWWYPSLCQSNKCQRPMVWSTTTKSRKNRRN